MTARITEVLHAELDEHGCEDDDEKRWQIAQHWAEKVLALFTEEQNSYYDPAEPYSTAYEYRWVSDWEYR